MHVENISLPKTLGIDNCIKFSNELLHLPKADMYEFDFSQMGWFPPFSMLYLAAQLKKFRKRNPETQCRAKNFDKQSYAAHMGFFKAFGLDYGNNLGEAKGSDTYLPLTEIVSEEILKEAMTSLEQVGDVLEKKASALAKILTREDKSDLFKTLRYSIREMLRNVVEHSYSDKVFFCAQYWRERNAVEVGICDAGIGIKASLSQNQNLKIANDEDAIKLSVLPGISGTVYKGKEQRSHYNEWQNSGYGLFMTSRICEEGGSFFLASGKKALLKAANDTKYIDQDFEGTAIRLILKPDRVTSLDKKLKELAAEGRKIAEHIGGADPFGPSIVSRISSAEE